MELTRKNVRTILFISFTSIALFTLLQNFSRTLDAIRWVYLLFEPIVLGVLIAFVLYVPARAFEDRAFKNLKLKKSLKRALSVVSAIVSAIAILFLVIFMLLPSIITSVNQIVVKVPDFVRSLSLLAQKAINSYPDIASMFSLDMQFVTSFANQALSWATSFSGAILNWSLSLISGLVQSLVTIFIGIAFAIYALLARERLATQFKSLIYAFLPKNTSEAIIKAARMAIETLSNYLAGQSLEASILFALTFSIMIVIGLNSLAFAVSALVALSSFVPVFGALFAMLVGAFAALLYSPVKALAFMLLYIPMQQIESNLIYPNVVGRKVGLPAIWTLFAVTIGLNLVGMLGAIIFIPLTSVAYTLLRSMVFNRLQKKKVPAEKLLSQDMTKVHLDSETTVDQVFSDPRSEAALEEGKSPKGEVLWNLKKKK